MKKTTRIIFSFFVVACLMACSLHAFAGNVDQNKAREVGAYFMASQFGNKSITAENLQLVYEFSNPVRDIPAMYVFNTHDKRGFVIVSANDCVAPIVAYSTEGTLDPNNIPPNMMWWLNGQSEIIAYAQNNDVAPTPDATKAWNELTYQLLPYFGQDSKAITRLTTSKWNQSPLYNSMCPYDDGGQCVTGCVATAMAQIMYYWKYPRVGQSSKSYRWNNRILRAYFNQTYYDYDVMVDALTSSSTQEQIDAVALLSYHCGISVEMSYSSESSGAPSENVVTALPAYFKYVQDSLQFIARELNTRYTLQQNGLKGDTNWVYDIANEIIKKRPVYYAGHDTNGGIHSGHAFVCDGWNTSTKTLHFNWGWGGSGDSWCNVFISNLAVRLNQNYLFNTNQRAILGITPPADSISINLAVMEVDNPFTEAIYPNPAKEQVTVSYNLTGNQNATLQVFDIAGRLVEQVTLSPASQQVTLSVAGYRPGVYFCRLNGHSSKFIVQ